MYFCVNSTLNTATDNKYHRWILDIKKLLTAGICTHNYYVFNPAIIKYGDLFLISYRIASYDISGIYHPWKIWDNGYKFFKNAHEAMTTKYRNRLGGTIVHALKSCPIVQKYSEYDSTGLAIASFDNGFKIIHNIANLFPDEMNQDAKLMICEGILTIIYNTFEDTGIKLRYRNIIIKDKKIFLSAEKYLFNHIYRNIEKHCAYGDDRNIIYYSTGKKFKSLCNGTMTSRNC